MRSIYFLLLIGAIGAIPFQLVLAEVSARSAGDLGPVGALFFSAVISYSVVVIACCHLFVFPLLGYWWRRENAIARDAKRRLPTEIVFWHAFCSMAAACLVAVAVWLS
jgi:hypothetical protein